MCVHLCILIYVWIRAFVMCMYICLYIYVNVCMCVYIYVCMYMDMYVYMYICIYVCIYVCIYIYVCVCIYVFIDIYTHKKVLLNLPYSISWLFIPLCLTIIQFVDAERTASRNVYFELTQEDFLSFSQNTFVHLYIFILIYCWNRFVSYMILFSLKM